MSAFVSSILVHCSRPSHRIAEQIHCGSGLQISTKSFPPDNDSATLTGQQCCYSTPREMATPMRGISPSEPIASGPSALSSTGTMPSADSSPLSHVLRCGLPVRAWSEASMGKNGCLRPMHPRHIRIQASAAVGLRSVRRTHPAWTPPRMPFLYVGPGLCLLLPSDSTSRWTPLQFG